MRRTVKDVMTRDVVLAHESWSFKDVVRHLQAARVSALPVLGIDGRLAGIVSEADLLLKEQGEAVGAHHGALAWRRRRERRKAEALTAGELMASPVVTIGPDETLAAAARLMHERGVKRLPVVDDRGGVVGIVSRRDLLKIFLRSDDQIRKDVMIDVMQRALWLDPGVVRVDVRDGVVTLEGKLETKSLADILVGLVRGVDGVVGIVPRLSRRPLRFEPWRFRPNPAPCEAAEAPGGTTLPPRDVGPAGS